MNKNLFWDIITPYPIDFRSLLVIIRGPLFLHNNRKVVNFGKEQWETFYNIERPNVSKIFWVY